ncbi:hypothetical protein BH10PSE7_BH10PSE7_18460 [soil metagenome]
MDKPEKLPDQKKLSHVRLELAREKDHPAGERSSGYDLMVPLDEEGRLDPAAWKSLQHACRVRRFRPNQDDLVGHLRRKPGGQWYFDYAAGEADDEIGFKLENERFAAGEYISISSGGAMHTFQVVFIQKP